MDAKNFSSYASTDKTVVAEGPPDPAPAPTYSIRIDKGIVLGSPPTIVEVVRCDVAIPDGHFIFYIQTNEFLLRVKGDVATYEKDWNKGGDALDCPGWGKDGILLGSRGGDAWPTRGLIAKKGRNTTPIQAQIDIWQRIARTIDLNARRASGTGRLWRPSEALDPKLDVTFAPLQGWLTQAGLKNVVDTILTKDSTSGVKYKDWIVTSVISFEAAKEAMESDPPTLVPLSYNLFSFYQTLITPASLKQLISLQTQERGEWLRPLPEGAQADDFHALVITDKTKKQLPHTITKLSSIKLVEDREDAAGIMGRQSANAWADKTLWPDQPITNLAEWLHRSAYSFGPLSNGNYQSPDNIVFGTYEANGDMTRAESSIRTALADATTGELRTELVQTGNETSLDAAGNRVTREIPAWVSTKQYSWLSPVLKYTGSLGTKTDLKWNTEFNTFSQYLPFTIEGQIDKEVLAKYVDLFLGKTPPKVPKLGPSGFTGRRIKSQHITVNDTANLRFNAGKATSLNIAPNPFPTAIGPVSFSRSVTREAMSLKLLQEDPGTQETQFYEKNPRDQLAWSAILKAAESVVIDGVTILQPQQKQPPAQALIRELPPVSPLPPVTGFVLDGRIKLFGLDVEVDLESWHGPPPAHLATETDIPVYQNVKVSSINASDFIPALASTPFAALGLNNVVITFQNHFFEPTKPLGWSLEADIDIGGENSFLKDLLTNVLKFDTLTIHVTAAMGLGHSWATLPQVTSFSLEGLVPFKVPDGGHGIQLCPGVDLSTVGVRLTGIERYLPGLPPATVMTYGVALFGEMNITVPGSVAPLAFDFEIGEMGGDASLNATISGDIWENAFGVNLDLSYLSFSATFSTAAPLEDLSFDVAAYLTAGASSAAFGGSFSVAGDYTVSASIEDWGCDGIADLFSHITGGDKLSVPDDLDLFVGRASITVSNTATSRLIVEVDNLDFNGHVAVSAKVDISSNGVVVEGKAEDIPFDDISIKLVDASIRAAFEKVGSDRRTEVTIAGTVQLTGFESFPTISAALYFSKTQTGLDWAIAGSFTDLGSSSSLGKLFSEFENTFFSDLSLQQLAFFASSTDNPKLGDRNLYQFPIHKGVQVCAMLGIISPFTQLLRGSAPNLILSAGWSSSTGFFLDVVVPSTRISLGRGITTEPVTLQLQTQPEARLQIAAGLLVPVPKADTPLAFYAYLNIAGPTVKIEGEMKGLWRNPFGISEKITIGPDLALGLEINLPQFVVSGTPDGFEFSGGLTIGTVSGQIAVEVSEDPMKELLKGSFENLSIQDIVKFTSDVTSLDLPTIPDFLSFKTLMLYLSTGAAIDTVYYPAGFSFTADVVVFGEPISISAAINESGFVAKGDVAALSVGPLKIHGNTGKDATMDINIGELTQHLKIDGAFSFLEASIAILLDLEILPSPTFKFKFDLAFTPLLTFDVDASAVGVDLTDLSSLDFTLRAVFKQHILDHIREQVIRELELAKDPTEDAIKKAREDVANAKLDYEANIAAAKKKLDDAHASWTAHAKAVQSKSQKAMDDDYKGKLQALNNDVDKERVKYNQALEVATKALENANYNRASQMRAAEARVQKAKQDMDAKISLLEHNLDQAQAAFNREFSKVLKTLDTMQAAVASLQNQINFVKNIIRDYSNAPWYEFWKKAAILYLTSLIRDYEVSRAITNSIIDSVRAIVQGTTYVAAMTVINTAKVALEAERLLSNELLDVVKRVLQSVDRTTNAIVVEANLALDIVRRGGDAAWKEAENRLKDFMEDSKPLLEYAAQAEEDIFQSAEWLAYQGASIILDQAKHAAVATDVATAALDFAENNVQLILDIGEAVITAATKAINITQVKLDGSFNNLVGEGDVHFKTKVEGVVIDKPFNFELDLDLRSPSVFIHAIFTGILDVLKPSAAIASA